MEPYIKHPIEDLTDAQLDDMLELMGIPFTPDSQNNIAGLFNENKNTTKGKSRARVKYLIPLIAIIALALVGFTQFDTIAQLFMDAFGNREIGQYAQQINGTSESQGIHMEMLSGFQDGNNTYLFVSLTDETGTHNLENLYFSEEQWQLSGYGGLYGVNCRMVRYEPGTNTAYLLVHGFDGTPGKSATFRLNGFTADEVTYDFEVPEINLSNLIVGHHATFNEIDKNSGFGVGFNDTDVAFEVALEKAEMHKAIPNYDRAILSNIGYQNGLLHIQLDYIYDIYSERISPYLVHTPTGEMLDYAYSFNYDGTMDFVEYVFKIPNTEEVENYSFALEGWYTADTVDENWEVEVSFIIPQQVESVTIPMGRAIGIDGMSVYVDTLELSPMGIYLSAELPIGAIIEVFAVYKDGSKIQVITTEDNAWLPFDIDAADDTQANRNIAFSMPIENYDSLQVIEINGETIEINDVS